MRFESNLMRLELVGVDVGARWTLLADAVDASWDDLSNPFTTLHVAMVLAATNQKDRLDTLIANVEQFARATGSLAAAYRDAPALLRAIRSHREGQHENVLKLAAPVRDALWRLGGSHAQRDVLFQIVFDSARRCRDQGLMSDIARDLARIGFIDPLERIAYRPD